MPGHAPIVFFDSGVGGLPYLDWTRRRAPNERFVYVADRRNFPYGETPRDRLTAGIIGSVRGIIDAINPKLLVLACNTASVVALAALRERFDVPVVGVVPAVKPAGRKSKTRRIGLLATSRTVADAYTNSLIDQFASDCIVTKIADGRIVNFVETGLLDASADDRRNILNDAIEEFRAAGIDTLVVGCTHFTHLEAEIRAAVGEAVLVVDSVEGVGRQVLRVLREQGIESDQPGP